MIVNNTIPETQYLIRPTCFTVHLCVPYYGLGIPLCYYSYKDTNLSSVHRNCLRNHHASSSWNTAQANYNVLESLQEIWVIQVISPISLKLGQFKVSIFKLKVLKWFTFWNFPGRGRPPPLLYLV